MNNLSQIKELLKKAEDFRLLNREILHKYSIAELSLIYNGIGPDAFPAWLRNSVSALHPTLGVVALIHDVEWHESDASKEKFVQSNERFKQNGYITASAEFSWFNPRRYIVMNQARRFGNYCSLFGWNAWSSPCQCAVCNGEKIDFE